MIAIIDYGMGNLRSVQKGLERVGFDAVVTRDVSQIQAAHGVVLPGVGAFSACMENLDKFGLVEPILGLLDFADNPAEQFGLDFADCLRATLGRLVEGRPLVFTYHSADPDAWHAIGVALDDGGEALGVAHHGIGGSNHFIAAHLVE